MEGPDEDTGAALDQWRANSLDRPHLYNLEEGPDKEGPDEEGPDEEGPDEEGVEQEEGVEAGGFGSACD